VGYRRKVCLQGIIDCALTDPQDLRSQGVHQDFDSGRSVSTSISTRSAISFRKFTSLIRRTHTVKSLTLTHLTVAVKYIHSSRKQRPHPRPPARSKRPGSNPRLTSANAQARQSDRTAYFESRCGGNASDGIGCRLVRQKERKGKSREAIVV
jgi:hypothetical protein